MLNRSLIKHVDLYSYTTRSTHRSRLKEKFLSFHRKKVKALRLGENFSLTYLLLPSLYSFPTINLSLARACSQAVRADLNFIVLPNLESLRSGFRGVQNDHGVWGWQWGENHEIKTARFRCISDSISFADAYLPSGCLPTDVPRTRFHRIVSFSFSAGHRVGNVINAAAPTSEKYTPAFSTRLPLISRLKPDSLFLSASR